MPNVRYFAVAGKHDGHFLHPEWLLPFSIITKQEGENDGVVSLASAELWRTIATSGKATTHAGRTCIKPDAPLPRNLRDPAPRYGAILRRLADEGY